MAVVLLGHAPGYPCFSTPQPPPVNPHLPGFETLPKQILNSLSGFSAATADAVGRRKRLERSTRLRMKCWHGKKFVLLTIFHIIVWGSKKISKESHVNRSVRVICPSLPIKLLDVGVVE
ncbi:hypothetical protein CDAR_220301 [Caerostris darwini]|uniref:Uncharacterized protein n=1 Tax=Caerostris darwini TaxID=1538125 RepID=A0AAV4UFI2_9ARAC|nr:hypothetical protein CDAR_220301 [Caerostris darwini]